MTTAYKVPITEGLAASQAVETDANKKLVSTGTFAARVAAVGAAMSGGAFHDGFSDFVAAEHVSLPNTIANVLTDHNIANHNTLALYETITAATTLYIATTGSDTTGDGSNGNPWLTVGKALTYLSTKFIASGITVTIQLADGVYAHTSQIEVRHPCGPQIKITGTNTYSKSMSSVQGSSGAAGAWSIEINLDSVANIAVDDYVVIHTASGGTRPLEMCGCHKVTAVDGVNTRITITNVNKAATAPSGNVVATVVVFKTFLTSTSAHGIYCTQGYKLGALDKVVLIGNNTAGYRGLIVDDIGYIGVTGIIGVVSYQMGILAQGGGRINCNGFKVAVSGSSGTGVYASFAQVNFPSGIVSGSAIGVESRLYGCAGFNSGIATGNDYGIISRRFAVVDCSSATVQGSTTQGVYAASYGYCYAQSIVMSDNIADYSPAVNTLGNENGYIDT